MSRPKLLFLLIISVWGLAACSDLGTSLKNQTPETAVSLSSCEGVVQVCVETLSDGFPLIKDKALPDILTDEGVSTPVRLAVDALKADLYAVSDASETNSEHAIIIGEVGQSKLLQDLISAGKLDVSEINGVWEGFVQAVIDKPMDGIERALVIAGADKRGTIYGIYDLSERIGVSPWHWWADVPIQKHNTLYISGGQRSDRPDVQYRGIFLNDENPALYGWVNEKYGGFGDEFYAEVFELILRLKGNYIWPAMWGKAYYDDDPDNVRLARDYGIVVGTSHHEPLGRAHVEWERYGTGPWDYTKNEAVLKDFWRGGMDRMKENEVLVTIGMRGDGDEAMTEGTAIALLERIVKDQRDIIEEVTEKPASETPQVWALYKEVQDYYDQGMQVPDDVLLLFADDNWGNIRRLPDLGAERPGGYGIYYHFDYVGGPRNYKWLNTTQIERVWEQMSMASAYGADRLWIVNVGDLKPMEFPISFFLNMGWDNDFVKLENLPGYYEDWSEKQFGAQYAKEIGHLIKGYTKLNSRRKPELIEPGTFTLMAFNEAQRVSDEWKYLSEQADKIRSSLDSEYHDAFDQLVWWPIKACANLNDLYIAAEKNRLYSEQKRASANEWADKTEAYFERDAELTDYYHRIADGKWNHFASQTHIGYTYWQQPEQNNIPKTYRHEVPKSGVLGLAIEGDRRAYFGDTNSAVLPIIDKRFNQSRYVTIFNTGQLPLKWTARSLTPGLNLSEIAGEVMGDSRIEISIDWTQISDDSKDARFEVSLSDSITQMVVVPLSQRVYPKSFSGYVPREGIISINAENFTSAIHGATSWGVVDNLSNTGSGVISLPMTARPSEPGKGSAHITHPHLAYDVYLPEPGQYTVSITTAPSLDYWGKGGLRYGVSLDEGAVQAVTIHAKPDSAEWNEAVATNRFKRDIDFEITSAGPHTLNLWRIDPGVVFQHVMIHQGDLPYSYLGPPPQTP